MKRFIFDSILDEDNICNLEGERDKIRKGVEQGLKMLVYGKRNTGKTSLIKNVIAKDWLKSNSNGFFMYVDLMGVVTMEQLSERMTLGFIRAYNQSFSMKSKFQSLLKVIKGIRPSVEIDEKGLPRLTFGVHPEMSNRSLMEIVEQVALLFKSGIPVLLVLDEFQDIANIEEAAALFRQNLEQLDPLLPVVVLGSKYHLLNQMFAQPKAPFFNWGTHVAFEAIDYQEYWEYMNDRFQMEGYTISLENACFLQDLMSRVPEAINRLCFALMVQGNSKGEITREQILAGLSQLASDRRTEPEYYLSRFTVGEQKVIIALAQSEPVLKPQSKGFVQSVQLTTPGVRKIIIKLENEAVIYREEKGYVLADPLLKQHILHFRL